LITLNLLLHEWISLEISMFHAFGKICKYCSFALIHS
jgi:hypothetical protein